MEATEATNPTFSTESEVRLFTEKAIATSSAIGGPLAGTYLISKNFASLRNEDAARLTMIIGVAFTFVLFTAIAFVPESTLEKVPKHLIPLAYGIIGYLIVKRYQQKDIDTHLTQGGKKGSWRVVVGVGIVSLVLTLGCFALIVFLTAHDEQVFAGTQYAFESSGHAIYYDSPEIPEADVEAVGTLLKEIGYFSDEEPMSAGLRKQGDVRTIELLVDEENWNHPILLYDARHLLYSLSQAQANQKYYLLFVSLDSTGNRKTKLFNLDD